MPDSTNDEQFNQIAIETWQKYFGDYAFIPRDGMRPLIAREYCSELTALIHQHTEQAIKMSEHCVVHGNNISHVHCCHAITRASAYLPAHNQP